MSRKRSLASLKAYSRKVIPLGWRNIIIKDYGELARMGKNNLEQMLAEWRILNVAYSARLKFAEANDGCYYSSFEYDNLKESYKDSEFAIKMISQVLPNAVPKPIFSDHRSIFDTYTEGERVFACSSEDGAFYPVLVIRQELENVFVRFDTLEGCPEGVISSTSPLLLKPEELMYLTKDPEYARLFACASGLAYEEDIQLYLDMVEDCANMYFGSTSSDSTEATNAS